MLGWIPVLGPILQGLFGMATSIYGKFADTKIEQIKGDATIDSAAIANAKAYDGDRIVIRIYQDLLIGFPVVWSCLVGWDSIWAIHDPSRMWHVAAYPPSLSYLPYMAAVYLLGATGLVLWKRK